VTEFSSERVERRLLPVLSCILSGAVLFGAGYGIWENVPTDLHAVALAASLVCYLFGFGVLAMGMSRSRRASAFAIAGYFVAFIAYSSTYLLFKVPYYASDALLFNSYSAQLFLSGVDPYTHSMQPGYGIFGVPEGEITPTVAGGAVFSLSYPALSFLVYVPFLAVGITNLLWVSVLAHAAILVLLIVLAPPQLRSLAPLALFIDPSYFDYTVGGITDVIWLAPAMLVANYWYRNPAAAAAWLGVASAVKQTPWVIIPFALVHWLLQARQGSRPAALFVPIAILLGTFGLLNAPFILWHPGDWLNGILTPLTGHLVILGSGIAQLGAAGLMPLAPQLFLVMTAAAFVCVFGLYAVFPRRLAFLPFLAPAFVLFFAARSLQNYFMYWPIVLLAFVFAQERDKPPAETSLFDHPAALGSVAAVALCFIVTLVGLPEKQGLTVSILGAAPDPRTGRTAAMRIAVRNPTDASARVHFDVSQQGQGFDVQAWGPTTPIVLAPRELRELTLTAPSPDFELESNGTSGVQVVAVAENGKEFISRPRVFSQIPPKIHNGDLDLWSSGSHPFPIAWHFDSAAWDRGEIARAVIDGRSAVRLQADHLSAAGWKVSSLQQVVDGRPGTLSFSVYPLSSYRDSAAPSSLFGITLVDVVGHRLFYTIDAQARSPASYFTPWGTINTVPGKLRAWNVITVDLKALHDRDGFALSPSASIGIGAVSATRQGQVVGYFGGASDDFPGSRAAASL
jgi:uncharacterized membrane protein